MKHRFMTCVLFGVLVAAVLAWFSAMHRHAGLVAAAAKSHQTTGAYLAGVSSAIAFTVAVAAFVVTSILAGARKRSSRSRPERERSERPRRGRRLRGDGGYYYSGGGYR
jgi:hypothetical protein